MKKQWFKLEVYVYNQDAINEVLQFIISEIAKYDFLKKNVIISKKWQMGPHISILYNISQENVEKVNEISGNVRAYLDSKNFLQTITYERHFELSKRIAQLEEYDGALEPLRKHLEVISGKTDLDNIHTVFPKKVYTSIEKILSEFVCEAYGYYYRLSRSEQDEFLAKCMIILGNQQEKKEYYNGGVQYGYMTFQSHYYGFVSQLNLNKESERMIFEELQRMDSAITAKLTEQMPYITAEKIDAVRNEDESLKYLEKWQKAVIKMLKIYDDMLEKKDITWNENHNMGTFFTRNAGRLSQFHSYLQKKEAYMDFLESDFFLKHRLTINAFYTILPLFGVSPLRKHKLCKYVADSVEYYYGQDYRSVMERINQNYRRAVAE